MISLEVLKQSPTYDYLINEGKDRWKEEGIVEGEIKSAARTLRMLIARRFPKMKVAQKIRRIRDASLLEHLIVEAAVMQDAAALRKRLDEAIESQDQ